MSVETGSLSPRNRYSLSGYYFFSFASLGFVSAFLPLFLKSRGLTLTQIGALSAIHALAGAGTQIPLGMLSDRLGRRKPMVIIGAILLGSIYLFFNRTTTFAGFCALYFVCGVIFLTIATLTNALISDWTAGTRNTGRSFGNIRMWGSLGFISTLAIISVMPGLAHGRNLLPAITVLFWISGLAISPAIESERHVHQPQPLFGAVPSLLKNTNLSLFLVTFFLFRICESGGIGFLSIYMRSMHASNSLIALVFATSAVIEIPFMVWVGGASDRIGRRPPLVIAFLAMPVRLFLYSLISRPEEVFFVQLFHGLTFAFMLVSSLAFVADLCPGELRATGQGLLSMTAGIAMALGPFLGGWLADRTSIGMMYVALTGVAAVSGLIFILFVHESHPDLSPERLRDRVSARHRLLRPVIHMLSKPLIAAKPQSLPE